MSKEEYDIHIQCLTSNGRMNLTDLTTNLKTLEMGQSGHSPAALTNTTHNETNSANGQLAALANMPHDSTGSDAPQVNSNLKHVVGGGSNARSSAEGQISFAKWTFLGLNETYIEYENVHRTSQS